MKKHLFYIVFAMGFEAMAYSSENAQPPAGIPEIIGHCEQAYEHNAFEQAYLYAIQARDLLKEDDSPATKALVSFWLGKCCGARGEFQNAITEFNEAINYNTIAHDTLQLARCHNEAGRLYKKKADYPAALRAFNRARIYYFAAGDEPGLAVVTLNVGNVLKSIGQTKLAKKEYFNALKIFKNNGDTFNEAGCYNNLGNIFKNTGDYDSAFYYMYRTLSIREQDSSLAVRAYIYHNLASLHLVLHNTDSALYYTNKSLAINRSIPSEYDMAFDYNQLGSIYMELKDYETAITYLVQALELSADEGQFENRLDILKRLGQSYHATKNYRASSDHFLSYTALSDSIHSSNENTLVESELIRYTLFADSIRTHHLILERDLEQSKKENSELANEVNSRNFYYILVILLLVIAIIVISLISARRRLLQTRQHQDILQVQNEELRRTLISKEEKEVLLKEVHHRVKNNLQIINSLIRLQSNFMNAGNFREKLVETENRIRSMALIHEKLYKTGNLASLSVRNYIEELCFNIIESYENHNVKIRLKFDLEEREYSIDTLIPIGLIMNEILSNSLKHAFYDREEGHVWITIHSGNGRSQMIIRDDGLGADLTLDELKEDSLGIELILSLTEQLDGTVSLHTEKGFEYRFDFPLLK